jgi:hypothetical protein
MADSETPLTRQFEFSPEQNAVIGDLARKMRLVGFVALFCGILTPLLILLLSGNLTLSLSWLLYILVGSWMLASSRAFRDIVETQGRDITHLMSALAELKKFFTLSYWLIIIVWVLIIAGVLLGAWFGWKNATITVGGQEYFIR